MFDSIKAIRDGGYGTVVVNLQDGPWVCRVGPPVGDVVFDHGFKEFFTVLDYHRDGKFVAQNGCLLLESRTEFVGSLVAKIRKVRA
jgi:hypothetical protein